jgi:hypothetical protein
VTTRRLHLSQGMRTASPYLDVPFVVPRGTDGVEVRLTVGDPSARVDLGCRGPHGWRGWSGGARRRFAIGRDAATWGYRAGELEPGEWNVVLGLHVLPADGVDVELEILVPGGAPEADPPAPRVTERIPLARRLPSAAGRTWYAGDMHAHSLHSDGELSLEQLAALAVDRRLDFLAVTDHNTVSHHPHLDELGARRGISLLPGQEVTTARGHANAFGRIGWVDFREHPDAWRRAVDADGGFLSINHAVSGDCSWQWTTAAPPSHAEVMHSSWFADPASTSIFSWLSARGAPAPALLGGTDFHAIATRLLPGQVTTWVEALDPGVDALLEAARAGRTAVSLGVDAPLLLRVDGALLAIDAHGLVFGDAEGRRSVVDGDRVELPTVGPGPYRLERADRVIVAMSL